MFGKIAKSIQNWSEQNPEKAQTILAWAENHQDDLGFQIANVVVEASASAWVALGRPGAGGETESDRLYNLAYNSGLKGQERAAAIKDYLEYQP